MDLNGTSIDLIYTNLWMFPRLPVLVRLLTGQTTPAAFI